MVSREIYNDVFRPMPAHGQCRRAHHPLASWAPSPSRRELFSSYSMLVFYFWMIFFKISFTSACVLYQFPQWPHLRDSYQFQVQIHITIYGKQPPIMQSHFGSASVVLISEVSMHTKKRAGRLFDGEGWGRYPISSCQCRGVATLGD